MIIQLAAVSTTTGLTAGSGRGPGGQPMIASVLATHCPINGCSKQIDPSRLMCRRHWYLVPKLLRDRVWATWRSGAGVHSAEHRQAVLIAITACQQMPAQRR